MTFSKSQIYIEIRNCFDACPRGSKRNAPRLQDRPGLTGDRLLRLQFIPQLIQMVKRTCSTIGKFTSQALLFLIDLRLRHI